MNCVLANNKFMLQNASVYCLIFLTLMPSSIVSMPSVAPLRGTKSLKPQSFVCCTKSLIFPLVIVFGVTYFGINNQQLTATFKANAGAVKLFTTALFAVLGGWLGYLLFR